VSQPDIEQELADLRARVRRTPAPQNDLTPLQKAIASVNVQWHISATLPPPAPGAPFTWRIVYFFKRAARRVMVELLNTLVQQQNTFNREVARALTELAAHEEKVIQLENRVAELEKSISGKQKET
jgi:hypothetical protein